MSRPPSRRVAQPRRGAGAVSPTLEARDSGLRARRLRGGPSCEADHGRRANLVPRELYDAVRANDVETVSRWLEAGGDVSAVVARGVLPAHATGNFADPIGEKATLLYNACMDDLGQYPGQGYSRTSPAVAELLIRHGAVVHGSIKRPEAGRGSRGHPAARVFCEGARGSAGLLAAARESFFPRTHNDLRRSRGVDVTPDPRTVQGSSSEPRRRRDTGPADSPRIFVGAAAST